MPSGLLHVFLVRFENLLGLGNLLFGLGNILFELDKFSESDKKYLKKAGGHSDRNIVQITIKMRTIVRIIQIILIIKPRLKNSEK